MVINSYSLFNGNELAYRELIENGGILVDDRWFPKDSSDIERARYHASYLRRQERNRRRRERRHAVTEPKPRVVHSGVSQLPESRESNRLSLERRKCLRRSTVAECPTVGDIRAAWRYRNDSVDNRLRLGALLMDLECYLDNSLIVIMVNHRRMIVGRNGGLRAWVREHCPELEAHYKTLQRIKGIAKLVRQRFEIVDPVPLSVLLNNRLSGSDVLSAKVHVQPRNGRPFDVRDRFAWEKSDVHYDAHGRPYLMDENYHLARLSVSREFAEHLSSHRAVLHASIILNGKEICANENYSARDRMVVRSEGVLKGFGEMFAYIGRHPEFLAEAGMSLVRDAGRDIREAMLPARTNRRIKNGERVGIGRLALDLLDAYMNNIYEPSLVYRWGRGEYAPD